MFVVVVIWVNYFINELVLLVCRLLDTSLVGFQGRQLPWASQVVLVLIITLLEELVLLDSRSLLLLLLLFAFLSLVLCSRLIVAHILGGSYLRILWLTCIFVISLACLLLPIRIVILFNWLISLEEIVVSWSLFYLVLRETEGLLTLNHQLRIQSLFLWSLVVSLSSDIYFR